MALTLIIIIITACGVILGQWSRNITLSKKLIKAEQAVAILQKASAQVVWQDARLTQFDRLLYHLGDMLQHIEAPPAPMSEWQDYPAEETSRHNNRRRAFYAIGTALRIIIEEKRSSRSNDWQGISNQGSFKGLYRELPRIMALLEGMTEAELALEAIDMLNRSEPHSQLSQALENLGLVITRYGGKDNITLYTP